jgi:hypothetical protein
MIPFKTSKRIRETDRNDRIVKLVEECESAFDKMWAGTWSNETQITVARSHEPLDIVFAAVDLFEEMLLAEGYPIARVDRRQFVVPAFPWSNAVMGAHCIVVVMS